MDHPTDQLQAHPACQLFPMMDDTELAELADDIRRNGLVEPVVLWKGMVLDGRNRLAACKMAGVEPQFIDAENIASPALYVVSKNLRRRHLTTSQRAAIAAEIIPLLKAEAEERRQEGRRRGGSIGGVGRVKGNSLVQNSGPSYSSNASSELRGKTCRIAGSAVGVSHWTVEGAARVKEAAPEEFERIKRGEITVTAALKKIEREVPTPNRRRQLIANAAKRRMVETLSEIRGMCRGLMKMDVAGIRSISGREEICTWHKIAWEASRSLRLFARQLTDEEGEGEKQN